MVYWSDQVTPIPSCVAAAIGHPCLDWVLLVSLPGHLLCKLVHLLCGGKGTKLSCDGTSWVQKLHTAFNNFPFSLSNWERVERLGCWKSWISATQSTVFHKDWVMNSFSTAHKYIWVLDEFSFSFFFFFSQIVESSVIPSPLFSYLSNPQKSRHSQWINEDVLCSLQWEPDLKYLHYHIACLLRGSN